MPQKEGWLLPFSQRGDRQDEESRSRDSSAKGLATSEPLPSVRDKLEHFLLIQITPIANTRAALFEPLVGTHFVRADVVQDFLVGFIVPFI